MLGYGVVHQYPVPSTQSLINHRQRHPLRPRLLLKLRFEDELPAREIATLMHLPTVFHAYRRLNALLASLRRTLEDAGVDDAQG